MSGCYHAFCFLISSCYRSFCSLFCLCHHEHEDDPTLPDYIPLPDPDFIAALKQAGIKGDIETPGHLKYIAHTIPWNIRVRPKPQALVYATNANDVSLAVKVASQFGVAVQARSGGHSFASYSLGGRSGELVIDLKAMDKVTVDQTTWQATIGGGTRLGAVTKELYAQGKRTIAHGTCPQVGIGGHATVGGQGPLSRMYGLTLDHIIDCEVVLADGTITRANAKEKPDLFWALRGAGASFGIVTSFVFETHPALDTVTHYSFQFTIGSPDDLAVAFSQWQEFLLLPQVKNDRGFNSVITVMKSVVLVQGTRYGSEADLRNSEVYALMQKYFSVSDVKVWSLDWLASALHWATDAIENIAGGLPIPAYMKSLSVRQDKPLTDETLKAWFRYMHTHSPGDTLWVVLADFELGRIADFANDATAYAQRDALYTIAIYGIAPLPFPDDSIGFLNGMTDTITSTMPEGNFGAYPGYVDPLIPKTQWPTQYWGANYPRLLEVKAKYDPKNVFANPQSVGADKTGGGAENKAALTGL